LSGFAHPAFEPYRDLLARLAGSMALQALNEIANQMDARHAKSGSALRFASLPGPTTAAQYEQSIAATGIIPTRENNLHDFLNALVWLRFPQLKSELNLRHCEMLERQPGERKQRGRLRDQLTLLDESGMLAISSDPGLLDLLRGKKWTELFWEKRAEVVQHMRFIVVGHGLLEKCLAPFPGMTAKCLFLHTPETCLGALDAFAAKAVRDAESLELPPLPVQGVPGWDDNACRAYYQNTEIFRPARTPPPAA
jgi:hypothetical protein